MNIAKELITEFNQFKRKKKLYLIPVRLDLKSDKQYYVLRCRDEEKREKQLKKYNRASGWIYMTPSEIAKGLGLKNTKTLTAILKAVGFYKVRGNRYVLNIKANEQETIDNIYKHIYIYKDLVIKEA